MKGAAMDRRGLQDRSEIAGKRQRGSSQVVMPYRKIGEITPIPDGAVSAGGERQNHPANRRLL